jgi:hypothetical protein
MQPPSGSQTKPVARTTAAREIKRNFFFKKKDYPAFY